MENPTPETTPLEVPPQWFSEHTESDTRHFEKIDRAFGKLNKSNRALHKRMNELPTKEQADQMLTMLENMQVGVSVFKVSSRTLLWFGASAASLLGIARFWKGIVAILFPPHLP